MTNFNENNQNLSISQLSESLGKYCPDYKVRPSGDKISLSKGMHKTTIQKSNNSYNISSSNLMVYVYAASMIVIILCIGWLIGKRKDDLYFMLPSIIGIVSLILLIYNSMKESKSISQRIASIMK
ncbi:MAG: hypothetical protein IPL95_09700 [Saprospiraceae bacterium]|nr:hypothetical protein [Saprospiraceae bacterium]